MTLGEMNNRIQEYCQDAVELGEMMCPRCKIETLCDSVDGDFEAHPEVLKQAYEIIEGTVSDDVVNHPSHYTQGNIECIEAMEAAFGREAVENFCLCNAFKYVWRNGYKNGLEDIDKAIWYLNKFKELCSNE